MVSFLRRPGLEANSGFNWLQRLFVNPLPLCLLGKSDTTHLPKQIQTLDQEKEEQSYKSFHEMAVVPRPSKHSEEKQRAKGAALAGEQPLPYYYQSKLASISAKFCLFMHSIVGFYLFGSSFSYWLYTICGVAYRTMEFLIPLSLFIAP